MPAKKSVFGEAMLAVNNDPSENNWKAFAAAFKKSGAKYYRVVFTAGKLKGIDGLRSSYVELYDSKYKSIGRVPVFTNVGKGIEGATIYLKGLQVNNR